MNTEIENAASEQGLIFLGAVSPEYKKDFERFTAWLAERRHAELQYLENHASVRGNPSQLLEGAQSAVILALPYFLSGPETVPRVAQYARYADYHRVLRRKAENVARSVFDEGTFRVAVDSAPLLERALAAKTHRGFIGKNTLYIHPDRGSFLLLAEVLTQTRLERDVPSVVPLDRKTKEGGCGPCKLCQTACPTGALDRDYSMDASKCLSYWTIENRGAIPLKFWPYLAEYYFGCDLCQLACPYNLKAQGPPPDWKPRSYPPIEKVAVMNQAEYEVHFGGTALT